METRFAAAIFAALYGGTGADWVGRGTGVDDAGLTRKADAVDRALALHADALGDPMAILARLGGREVCAMLGAIIGDIVGSVYEFRNHRSKVFEPFFHPNAFYTDDTICTVAVADALVNDRHPAQALKDWGRRYWDNGGWGQRFAMWLASDELAPYGSFGNGAAMRVAPAMTRAGARCCASAAPAAAWSSTTPCSTTCCAASTATWPA